MPRKIVVRRNWSKNNGFKLATTAKEVQTGMTGNDSFPKPPVALAEMDTQIANLFNHYTNRKDGSKARADYKNSLAIVLGIMTDQADYVDATANGNQTMIESSGFKSTSGTSSRKPVPAVPGVPTVKNENGDLVMSIEAVPYATSYFWIVFIGQPFGFSISNGQMWAEKPGEFIIIPAGTTREVVRGLAPGTAITVQVLAQNSAGKSDFTMPVSTYAVKS